jgi:rhodanese-related sulfurtransferase
MKKLSKMGPLAVALAGVMMAGWVAAADHVKITADLDSVKVMHNGQEVVIQRSGDKEAHIPDAYMRTSRECPPFCVQPMHVAPGVETVGELDVLSALKRIADGDQSILVVDSRTPEWIARGTIPGSVSVPWNLINLESMGGFVTEAEAASLGETLTKQFGATEVDGRWDFSSARDLVLFCNGAWCPQSSINIKTLLKLGYPPSKLKWYRGGMQDWVTLGLTIVH